MKRLIGFLGFLSVIILLAAAFMWTDFHMATSQTKIESQVSTYSIQGQKSEKLPENLPIQIYVEGNDLFSRALIAQLNKQLEPLPHFSQVSVLSSPPQNSNQSILSISPDQSGRFWTPVYSNSQFTVHLVFASDGDISWQNDEVIRMPESAIQVVRVRAEFSVKDTSFGLISRIYYQKYLAERFAEQIAESLSSTLDAQTNQSSVN